MSGEAIPNFTPRAVQALALARKEAKRLNHNFLGTEHLLLGLIKLGQGVSFNVLQKMGLDLETARWEVEKQVGIGPYQEMLGNIPYTPRVKRVFALAQQEAKELNHNVGTEHLLLGLLREGGGVAAKVLRASEVDIQQCRRQILKELDPHFASQHAVELPPGTWKQPTEKPAALDRYKQGELKMSCETAGNFTPHAQKALALARQEADRLHHNFLGTEHLLLGLIKLGQEVPVNVLQKMGLNLETVRREVEKQVGTRPEQNLTGNFPYTPRVTKVLALAQKEAKKLSHTYVGAEHLLLGLLREGDGVAAKVLRALKVEIEQCRLEILKELDPNFGSQPVAEVSSLEETPADNPAAAVEKRSKVNLRGETIGSLTPRAQQVLALARQEADRLNQKSLGTEHLLLGLIQLGQGVSFNVLQKMGLDLETVRMEVVKHVGTGSDHKMIGNLPYSRDLKHVLALAQ